MTLKPCLVIMARQPVAGAVKRRLSRDIGPVMAVRFYRHTLRSVVGRVGHDQRWHTILAVTPHQALSPGGWVGVAGLSARGPRARGIERIGQAAGDLEARMQAVMSLDRPGPIIIIGSDIPRIDANNVWRAFRLLARHDAVFGPARDGGYWLVGLRRAPKILKPFRSVRWSSEHALRDTMANVAAKRIALVDLLADVDDGADYFAERNCIGRLVLPKP